MLFLFIVFALVLQILLFLTHWFLYLTLVRFLNITDPGILFSLKIALGVLSFTFVTASLLANISDNILLRAYYTAAAFWLGALLYLIVAGGLAYLAVFLAQYFSVSFNASFFAQILIVAVVAVSVFGAINASLVRVTRLNIKLPNLPAAWQGKTVVWLSDIHLGEVRNVAFARSTADIIRQLKPDIVFIGGDLYDGTAVNLAKNTEPYKNLGAALGTYFITGNHEEFDGKEKYLDAVRRADIRILNNEMVNINGLQIIGVDYQDTSSAQKFKDILSGIKFNPRQANLLLKHAPTDIPVARDAGISFQISGHAHGGQLWPINYISNLVYRGYIAGLKQTGNMQIYISSGTGTWGPPLRVDTNPEIVLIKFE